MQQFLTSNEELFAPFAGQDVHGGPPVVLIDGPRLRGGQAPYYLGIFHFFMVGRLRVIARGWLPWVAHSLLWEGANKLAGALLPGHLLRLHGGAASGCCRGREAGVHARQTAAAWPRCAVCLCRLAAACVLASMKLGGPR